jgi:hypothetical protein
MLTQVAEGVLVHQSELQQNNTVVVQGSGGVLLIDPVITGVEMACLATTQLAVRPPCESCGRTRTGRLARRLRRPAGGCRAPPSRGGQPV